MKGCCCGKERQYKHHAYYYNELVFNFKRRIEVDAYGSQVRMARGDAFPS